MGVRTPGRCGEPLLRPRRAGAVGALLLGVAAAAAAWPAAASPYGINAHVPAPELLDRVGEAGVPWVRIDFIWSWVEPQPDRFQWGAYDALVDEALARGLRVYATIAGTPAWATAGAPEVGVPDNPNDWYDVVFRAVSRYRGRIDHWGLWNEPNLSRFWEGTRRQYIDVILRPGSAAVRAANPSARVCGPELAHLSGWDGWLRQVLMEAADALDIVTHHVYPADSTAASVVRRLNRNPTLPTDPPPVRRILQDTGWFGRPFWLTETGAHSGPRDSIQESTQAGFYTQLVAELFGPQRSVDWVDRVFFYELADDPRYADTFGILGPPPDYRPKIAFAAYRSAVAGTITDAAEATAVDLPAVLAPGELAEARITLRNTGTTTWTTARGYRLAALGDADPFADIRQDLPAEVQVAPGESWTFAFGLQAPTGVGPSGEVLTTEWQLVREGAWRFGDLVSRPIRVVAEPPEIVRYLPATANAPGLQGTRWRTDVELHNRGIGAATILVEVLEHGLDNTFPRRAELTVPAFSTLRLHNVLATLFAYSGTAALRWQFPNDSVTMVSRTYTEGPSGTSGQFTPPFSSGAGLAAGESGHLLLLAGSPGASSGFRTNIGFINTGPEAVAVEVAMFHTDGTPLGVLERVLLPFEFRQITNALEAAGAGSAARARAVVRPVTPGARVLAYASVVDNRTGDPIYVAPAAALSGTAFITNTAHTSGLQETFWRTALHLHNPGESPVQVDLELLPGGASPLRPRHTLWLPGGGDFWSDDAVAELFGFAGSAGLRLDISGGKVLAASRTYTTAGQGGTFGQHVPAVPLDQALGAGQSGRLLLLAQSADDQRGFRTNIGLLNVTGAPVTVSVSLFSAPWQFVGTVPVTLPGHGWVQLNRVYRQVGGVQEVTAGFAQVRTDTPGARLLAYASVVDNGTGDPVYVPSQ